MQPYTQQPILAEQDLVYSLLCDLKRVVKEYATAATESSGQTVRQTFTNLLMDTLHMQTQVYQLMQQNGWYPQPSPALQQDMVKALQQNQQTQQKTQQLMQQNLHRSANMNMKLGGINPMQGQPIPIQGMPPSGASAQHMGGFTGYATPMPHMVHGMQASHQTHGHSFSME